MKKCLTSLAFSLLVFISSFSIPSAQASSEYQDFIVKVHINELTGRLYSFNPEGNINNDIVQNSFRYDFDPTQTEDYKLKRNHAQSVFLDINFINDAGEEFFPSHSGEEADILLVNATHFVENTDGGGTFVLSPYDGFLHFKIQKEFLQSQKLKSSIELRPPVYGQTPLCIDYATCRDATDPDANSIERGQTPYGFFDFEDEKGNSGLYQKEIDLFIEDELNVTKVIADLVILRNIQEPFPYTDPSEEGENWTPNDMITFVQKFALRGHHTLDWVLQIDSNGMEHPSILEYHQKIIQLANALLIFVILTIALLWNFSAFIPMVVFRKIMILFFGLSIVMNLSAPLVKLVVQGANILQTSFLYTTDEEGNDRKIVADDFFYFGDLQYQDIRGYAIENGTNETIDLARTHKIADPENAENAFDAVDYVFQKESELRKEDRMFNSFLLFLTALGYFLIAGIFLIRIIILWFLIILSPILFILPILPYLTGYFRYWIWLFVRWIAIGPLLAICVGATIFIWKGIGVPITSLYSSDITFSLSGNFHIASPGYTNYGLYYTKPMVEYIAALIMLFLPVFLSFWLTRRIPETVTSENKKEKKWKLPKMKSSMREDAPPPKDKNSHSKILDLPNNHTDFRIPDGKVPQESPSQKSEGNIDFSHLEKPSSQGKGFFTAPLQNMETQDLIQRYEALQKENSDRISLVGGKTEKETIHEELTQRAEQGDSNAKETLKKPQTFSSESQSLSESPQTTSSFSTGDSSPVSSQISQTSQASPTSSEESNIHVDTANIENAHLDFSQIPSSTFEQKEKSKDARAIPQDSENQNRETTERNAHREEEQKTEKATKIQAPDALRDHPDLQVESYLQESSNQRKKETESHLENSKKFTPEVKEPNIPEEMSLPGLISHQVEKNKKQQDTATIEESLPSISKETETLEKNSQKEFFSPFLQEAHKTPEANTQEEKQLKEFLVKGQNPLPEENTSTARSQKDTTQKEKKYLEKISQTSENLIAQEKKISQKEQETKDAGSKLSQKSSSRDEFEADLREFKRKREERKNLSPEQLKELLHSPQTKIESSQQNQTENISHTEKKNKSEKSVVEVQKKGESTATEQKVENIFMQKEESSQKDPSKKKNEEQKDQKEKPDENPYFNSFDDEEEEQVPLNQETEENDEEDDEEEEEEMDEEMKKIFGKKKKKRNIEDL